MWAPHMRKSGGYIAHHCDVRNRAQSVHGAKTFQAAPPRIAGVAHDAMTLAIALARDSSGQGFSTAALTRAGGFIRVATRRGQVVLKARSDRDVAEGMVFIPFCCAEAAATSAPTAARGCSTSMRTSFPGSSTSRAGPTTTPTPSPRWCISRPPSG